MKAVDFIRKFGWLKACEIVANIPDKFMVCYYSGLCYCLKYKKYSDRFEPRTTLINIADLKQYVDAWVLVSKFGGLDSAKGEFFEIVHSGGYVDVSPSDLLRDIQLVESVEDVK